MPDKKGRLSGQEKVFVETMADTGNREYARHRAQYKSNGAASTALARPAIQAEIRQQQLARLHNDLLPLAMGTLETALTDDKVPWGSKMVAVKITLDRVFTAGEDGAQKDPATMTADEIAATLDRLKRELSDRAKPIVEVSPNPAETGAFD